MIRRNLLLRMAALLLASILLAGCAAMDEAQCRSTNWQERGERDGKRGRKPTVVAGYEKACQEFGVDVNTRAYQKGWDTGITQYCTREQGWKVGMSTTDYDHTCPRELEAEFYSAYQLARSVKDSKAEVVSVRRDLDEVLEKLSEEGLSADKRSQLKKDKKRLKEELFSAKVKEREAIEEARKMDFTI